MNDKFYIALLNISFLIGPVASAADWQIVASPNRNSATNFLTSVDAAADNDVWAVGFYYDTGLSGYRTLIEHWDGTAWTIIRSPNATNGYNYLYGIAVAAANDVWAVGQAANGSTTSSLIEHWDGSTWKIVPSPNLPTSSNFLQAVRVVSANDVWAVGYTKNAALRDHTLAMHWDGSAWSIMRTPAIGDGILRAIDAVTSDDVWAVGQSAQEARTLTIHWDGSAWSVLPSPNGINDSSLGGVAAITSSDVWAIGGVGGGESTLAMHWDGAHWTIATTPQFVYPQNNPALAGIVAPSSNNVTAVGQFLQGSLLQSLIQDFNGSTWENVASPNPANDSLDLAAIAATPNGTLWAVGTIGFNNTISTLTMRKTP